MPDLLDLTARQVRLDHEQAQVHKLSRAEQHHDGRVYWAACGDILSAPGGAILTTRETTCRRCPPPARPAGKGNASQAPGSPGQSGGPR
jgi:hypothetical protein